MNSLYRYILTAIGVGAKREKTLWENAMTEHTLRSYTNYLKLTITRKHEGEAMLNVGFLLEIDSHGERNSKRASNRRLKSALEWYHQAAQAGNGFAMFHIGTFYLNSPAFGRLYKRDDLYCRSDEKQLVQKNYKEALHWFIKAKDALNK